MMEIRDLVPIRYVHQLEEANNDRVLSSMIQKQSLRLEKFFPARLDSKRYKMGLSKCGRMTPLETCPKKINAKLLNSINIFF